MYVCISNFISLLMNIEKFVEVSEDYEKVILQKYTDPGVTVVCAPLFLPLDFPTDVWYPFSTEPLLRKFILYIMQIFIIAQTVFCLGVDIMIAVILFYSTAKLEILAFEVEQATNEIHIVSCIKKHQEIIE
ncbi:hypothetical protein ACFW04_013065 [Cataglyphis niger]